MPHISKQKIESKEFNRLYKQLVSIISPKKTAEATQILGDLLTETEQVMLTKRLAAIMMLAEGLSLYKVSETLGLSTSTVDRMNRNYLDGTYSDLLGVLWKRKRDKEEFWELISVLSRGGLPSMGRDRWKGVL